MRLSLEWIRDYVDLPDGVPAMEIAHALTLKTVEVEEVVEVDDDVILEIDNKSLTNRPDLWGHYGIARELAAIYDRPLRPLPTASRPSTSDDLVGDLDGRLCQRFAALRLDLPDGPGQAPQWLRRRLARIGEASVDAVVDLSNYVMFAVGQPTHVYDADRIRLPLSVRIPGEPAAVELLGATSARLGPDTAVVADSDGPVGVAGVLGASSCAVGPGTVRCVLEAATFRPRPVRRAAQRLGLRTEASARFEKGLDTQRVDAAIDLFLHLLPQVVPSATATAIQDVTIEATGWSRVTVGRAWLAGRIGADLDPYATDRTLAALGFDVTAQGDVLRLAAPTWRSTGDIGLPHDIVEEIARIHGYDRLPAAQLTVTLRPARALARRDVERAVRETMAVLGLQDVLTYPWVTDAALTAVGLDKAATVRFEGAPAPDRDSLRPSLVPNLLESAANNLRHESTVELFEVGAVFLPDPAPRNESRLAAVLTGNDGAVAFRRAKGVLEQLTRLGQLSPLSFGAGDTAGWADPSARVAVAVDGVAVGTLGLLTARTRRLAGLASVQVACLELDLGPVSANASRDNAYEAVPDLPEADFDLSVVVADAVAWSEIAAAAHGGDRHVHRVDFVDEFRGSWVPAGHRSVTLRITLRASQATLTSESVAAARARAIAVLGERTGARLRQ